MRQIFKPLINIFFIISIAYFISNISFFFLQKTPIFYYSYEKIIQFYDIQISNLFYKNHYKKEIKHNFLFAFKLNGVYNDGKKGFVILKDKDKTIFVDLNNSYKGYRLIKIKLNSAIFEKDAKQYIIQLNDNKTKKFYTEQIDKISRKVIKYYSNNLRLIWQNIGIDKTKNGYKIIYLNKQSILGKFGLKKGDILLEVNGIKLKNDNDAWNLFNNIDKFDVVKIVIKRDNKIKVFKYEIENN